MAGARILSRAMPGSFLVPKPYLTRPPPSVNKFVSRLSLGRVTTSTRPLSSGASYSSASELLAKLRIMSEPAPAPVEGARAMGGGPRTFPGGVSKWQWKNAQRKKEKQAEKARLAREKQLFDERRRNEAMATAPLVEKPWEPRPSNSPSPLPPVHHDPKIRALASRFTKRGAEELWTDDDGAVASSREESRPSARFLPKAAAGPGSNSMAGSFGGSSSSNGKTKGN